MPDSRLSQKQDAVDNDSMMPDSRLSRGQDAMDNASTVPDSRLSQEQDAMDNDSTMPDSRHSQEQDAIDNGSTMPDSRPSQERDAMNDGRRGLLKVPLEIFEEIVEATIFDDYVNHKEPADLLSLRLVSREICDKVQAFFIAWHIRDRMFLLSHPESLHTLLEIAQHPRFGRAVRTIMFDREELPDECHTINRDGYLTNPWMAHSDNAPTDTQREMLDREWKRLTQERVELTNAGNDIMVLTHIFEAFQRVGNIPAIKVITEAQAEMAAIGARDIKTRSGRALDLPMDGERGIRSLFIALSRAQLPLTSLTIDFDDSGSSIGPSAPFTLLNECASLVLKSLKQVDFTFWRGRREMRAKAAMRSAAYLRKCVALEELTIHIVTDETDSFDEVIYTHRFVTALLNERMASLKALALSSFCIVPEELVAFVREHPELRKMKFRDCFFAAGAYLERCAGTCKKQSSLVKEALQKATRLSDIDVVGNRVADWMDWSGVPQESRPEGRGEDDSEEDDDKDDELSD